MLETWGHHLETRVWYVCPGSIDFAAHEMKLFPEF